jgi:signal transduction histidine kinase
VSSVRSKVLIGALLWTFGMLAAFSVVLTYHHPIFDTFRVVHAHAHVMMGVALVLMAAGAAVVRATLAPLQDLRRNVLAVRDGSAERVGGVYPGEVQPLVDDLNALLVHLDEVVVRAGARAGDLAHGLKTPLAVLSNEADRLAAGGNPELASVLAEQIGIMRRYVEYHLAHARAAASGAVLHARSSVRGSVDGLVRTMRQLHADRRLSIETSVDPRHMFKGRREDLDEMVGNLLDNACKWGRERIAIATLLDGDRLVITIDDDGPGLEAEASELVLQRGVRRDERVPGSGLGLAIVRDLADLYGGAIWLDRSTAGGVHARLQLPGIFADASGTESL